MRRPGRKRSTLLCVFCRDALTRDGWRCPDCGVLVHAGCAEELRGARCPTLGCSSARAWEWADPPSRWGRSPRGWMAAALLMWVSAGLTGANLLAAAQAPHPVTLAPAARPAPMPEPLGFEPAYASLGPPQLEQAFSVRSRTLEGGCGGCYSEPRPTVVWRVRRGDAPPEEITRQLRRSILDRALWNPADGDVSRVSVLAGVFRATRARSSHDLGLGCFGEPLGEESWETWTADGLPFPVYELARVRAAPERLYSPLVDQITELVRVE